jgi:hypothetical protein
MGSSRAVGHEHGHEHARERVVGHEQQGSRAVGPLDSPGIGPDPRPCRGHHPYIYMSATKYLKLVVLQARWCVLELTQFRRWCYDVIMQKLQDGTISKRSPLPHHVRRALRMPPGWENLPLSASREAEVEWVHQNFMRVVQEIAEGRQRIRWLKARTAPPSEGAMRLMKRAASSPNTFDRDIFFKSREGGDDLGLVKEERAAIEEIRGMLEKYGSPAAGLSDGGREGAGGRTA